MVIQAYRLLSTTCRNKNYKPMSKQKPENWCYLDHSLSKLMMFCIMWNQIKLWIISTVDQREKLFEHTQWISTVWWTPLQC